jgi:hypothetical protein
MVVQAPPFSMQPGVRQAGHSLGRGRTLRRRTIGARAARASVKGSNGAQTARIHAQREQRQRDATSQGVLNAAGGTSSRTRPESRSRPQPGQRSQRAMLSAGSRRRQRDPRRVQRTGSTKRCRRSSSLRRRTVPTAHSAVRNTSRRRGARSRVDSWAVLRPGSRPSSSPAPSVRAHPRRPRRVRGCAWFASTCRTTS